MRSRSPRSELRKVMDVPIFTMPCRAFAFIWGAATLNELVTGQVFPLVSVAPFQLVAGKAFPLVSIAQFRSLRLKRNMVLDWIVLVREAWQWAVKRDLIEYLTVVIWEEKWTEGGSTKLVKVK